MTGLKIGIAVLALLLVAAVIWVATRRPEVVTVRQHGTTVVVVPQPAPR
ncbi:MAG: hypothetical protein K8T90_04755 [Planctomycetes bacterium]|nr:hypothetical protein [Planctomycetota bacterium]